MLTHEWHGGGNIFIRPKHLPEVGSDMEGHRHNFDHVTIVFTGAVRVEATGPEGHVVVRDFAAPAHCLIKADWTHRIVATVADTWVWCVYAHRTPQGDVVQRWAGWEPAYT